MADAALKFLTVKEVAESAAAALLSVRHWSDSSFITLPLIYPSGASVTVKLSPVKDGLRVSDGGLAYREIERFGAQRSFPQVVRKHIEGRELSADRRSVYADVPPHEVEATICDVGITSLQVAEQIVAKAAEVHAEDIADALEQRLVEVFGVDQVKSNVEIVGSSSTSWKVSAINRMEGCLAVFQAVSVTPMSIFRTSAAFHDLALLDQPPNLIAVVESKEKLGAKNLGILHQAGRVIEFRDSIETYRLAAA